MLKQLLVAFAAGFVGIIYFYFLTIKIAPVVRPYLKSIAKNNYLNSLMLLPGILLATPPFLLADKMHQFFLGSRLLDLGVPGNSTFLIVFSFAWFLGVIYIVIKHKNNFEINSTLKKQKAE